MSPCDLSCAVNLLLEARRTGVRLACRLRAKPRLG
jgi:hypothetical protein